MVYIKSKIKVGIILNFKTKVEFPPRNLKPRIPTYNWKF